MFVGDDAYIVPRRGRFISMAWLDGEMLCFYPVSLFHSMYCGGSVGLRDDVGIVPYIRVGVCAVHRAGVGS